MLYFSGLTKESWCQSLGISENLWAEYESSSSVPEGIKRRAVELALLGGAIRLNAISVQDLAEI